MAAPGPKDPTGPKRLACVALELETKNAPGNIALLCIQVIEWSIVLAN